jgi:hypothetical protein
VNNSEEGFLGTENASRFIRFGYVHERGESDDEPGSGFAAATLQTKRGAEF